MFSSYFSLGGLPPGIKLFGWIRAAGYSAINKKSCIRETPNLSTDADRSTNIFCWKKKFNTEWLLVLRALWVGPQIHQSTSQTPPTCEPSPGAIGNNSSFIRLYELVDECTSRLVKHLPQVDNACMQSRKIPFFRALRVGRRVHQSTSWTPPTHGRSMYAIQKNSLFLGLYKLVDKCTSPVWVKVAQVYFSEMGSGLKIGPPPSLLCHID